MIRINVLYLSYDGLTDPLGQSQVLPYVIGLTKAGYIFTIISCEKPNRYETGKHPIQNICRENNIGWYPVTYTKNPPILSTIHDLRKIFHLSKKLHKQKRFEMVHCRGYVTSIIGLKLKRNFDLPFLFDMRGFWADEKVDARAWRLTNPVYRMVYRYFKRKECQFIKESNEIVSLTYRSLDEMKNWPCAKDKLSKISIIPCCVDVHHFNPAALDSEKRKILKAELGIVENDIIVTYLGSIGTWYMLDEMIAFFSVFAKHFINAKMLFITFDEHERIRSSAKKNGLTERQIIIRPGERREVPLLVSLSNYSVFFIRPTFSKLSSSPTKQGEIMAMGIPVFCNSGIGDTDKIVQDFHSGIIIDHLANEDYEKAINSAAKTTFDAVKIREGAISYFDLQTGVNLYAKVYKKILNK